FLSAIFFYISMPNNIYAKKIIRTDSIPQYKGYTLAWHDEFDKKKLNEQDWNYEKGNHNGWGNHELEYYTSRPKNVYLSKGHLVIEARKEDYHTFHYTSARITTKDKKEFTYGRIDMRAKLPVSSGMWPALWMLGSNISTVNWPTCGEIDIMELIGKNPKQVVGSFHWEKANGTEGTINNKYSLSNGDFSKNFHVYSLTWGKDSMQILIDNIPYVKAARQDFNDGTYPFDKPFFLLFNVAVGGDWPGSPDDTIKFPQKMSVDYVRYYRKTN
ncbi:glycoside hydrolase family 16 protein, partial [Arachidicoccus sp.]|uniref:glycoside hydrolase family 16 protein n=1 Tax=Arachidicoccus sp. TaxID=1872624 RepID=UPI003D2200D3